MVIEVIIIGTIAIFILLIISMVLYKKINHLIEVNKQDKSLTDWLQSMQQSLDRTNNTISTTLQQNSQNLTHTLTQTTALINQRLDKAAQIVAHTALEIGKVNELGHTMKNLQLLLRSPKLRGSIGEEILTDMLKEILPKQKFFLQYGFKSGEKVDAAIQTSAGILSIDAKFPLENFQKQIESESLKEKEAIKRTFIHDIKKHIKAIADKYIRVDEGTLDFALMYIPSETVFYEIAQNTQLLEYCRGQRVYPVSPNTLYLHLQTILLSFEGEKLEVKSKQIIKLLRTIQKDYLKVEDSLQILGKHLNNATNQYSNASQQYVSMGQKLKYQELLEDKT